MTVVAQMRFLAKGVVEEVEVYGTHHLMMVPGMIYMLGLEVLQLREIP